jgi:hypothetical protein
MEQCTLNMLKGNIITLCKLKYYLYKLGITFSIFFAKKMQLEKSLPLLIPPSQMDFSKGKTKPSLEQS